ncbi:kinase-like protein [Xylariaceae sp. FL1272]|nr:kinase-like protein [Xylariaceae sp. FL1272]
MGVDFYTPLELPYDAPVDIVPPTHAEIMASNDIIYKGAFDTVVKIRHQFLAKFGLGIDQSEGENMIWVEQNTSLRIPKLYRMYRYDGNKTMIIMEYIPGNRLSDLLPSMTEAEKASIGKQLRVQINELRTLSIEGYYGSIGGRPYRHKMVSGNLGGPFVDFKKVIEDRFVTYHTSERSKRLDELREEYVRAYLTATSAASRAVFTHADLHEQNVLIQSDGTPIIIDWETAGFYPPYEEYLLGNRLNEQIPFLDPYPTHLSIEGETIRALRRLRFEARSFAPEQANEQSASQCKMQ